jgi:hypothetical protein
MRIEALQFNVARGHFSGWVRKIPTSRKGREKWGTRRGYDARWFLRRFLRDDDAGARFLWRD